MRNLVTLFFCLSAIAGFGQSTAQRQKHYNIEKGLAIQGYDPVSYFAGKPLKGQATFSYNNQGLVYRFATEANKALFVANPAKYEPAYGGWCAYAMGETGEKVEIDPATYSIVNGRLYLFYNAFFNNTLTTWKPKQQSYIPAGDAYWKAWLLK